MTMSLSALKGNTLTVELPEEIATELAAMTAEERDHFAVAALASALAEHGAEGDPDDPVAVAEIGAALAELEAAEARGERGLTLDEMRLYLEQSLVAHGEKRRDNASSPRK
jgi:hypothetical protein